MSKTPLKSNETSSGAFKKLFDIGFAQITELGGFVTYVIIAIFTLFFIHPFLFVNLILSLIAITVVAIAIKYFFFKDRPKKQSTNNLVERLDASSFPSIHTMRIFALGFWISTLFRSWIGVLYLLVIAILVSYSRIYLKKHYWSDVLGGLVLVIIIIALQWVCVVAGPWRMFL